MSTIKVDTNSLQTCIDNIDATKKYYAGKVSTFSGSYGAGNIGGYLSKIQSNYRGIVNNLDNVIKYISEYISDIEELEKNVDIGKSSNVSSHSLKSSGLTIVRNNIKAADLFDIGLPNSEKVYDYREAYNNLISLKDYHQKGLLGKAISLVAQAQTCVLAFKEGGLNVAENIGDGVLTATAALCTLFGYDEGAEKLGEVIKKDLSKEWYYKRIEELGLDKYANPNSTMAQVCSSAGNFVTNIGLRVALGLIPGASAVANPLIGGLTNIGQEAEFALRQGATIGQAEVVGLAGGVIGAAVDYGADGVANFLNNSLESTLGKGLTKLGLSDAALSKIATSTGGKIFGNIGIGGIGASEGALNLLTRTIVYEYDDNKSFSENLESNFKNDGVALQMAMAGGIRAGSNLVSGLFKSFRNGKLDAAAELSKADLNSATKRLTVDSNSISESPKVDLDSRLKNYKLFDDPDFEDDLNLRMMQSKPSKYSHYFFKQIVDSNPLYIKACERFVSLSDNAETAMKLKKILFDGGIDDYKIDSDLMNHGNPKIEMQKRISVANLLINNPDSFDYTVENKINLFHGTNANALPGILKNGLRSGASLESEGIDVLTGEAWSRFRGQRNFISMTDILDIAEDYSCLKPSGGEDYLSFSVVVGTTTDDAIKNGTLQVISSVPEVGLRNLPKESVKCVYVPSDKIDFVKLLVGDDNIAILGMDNIEHKFCYSDDGYLRFNDDIFEQYASSSLPKSDFQFSQDEIADFVNNIK